MARPIDEKNREKVQENILTAAREVFCQKGYRAVTMSDLIKAAGLSRGGFYFYYKSVDEVFRETVRNRTKSKFEALRQSIADNPDFYELLDDYFARQKRRLQDMHTSLLWALYEYMFIHNTAINAKFRAEQRNNILDTVNEILQLGVRQEIINRDDTRQIAEHYMFTIEGLNVKAMFHDLSDQTIDEQLHILRNML